MSSVNEYEEVHSTKVDSLMMIIQWHLVSDNNSVYWDLDKELTAEQQQQLDDKYDKDTDLDFVGLHSLENNLPDLITMGRQKILVFTEFPMMAPLLKAILMLHNISVLTLHGSHTTDEHNKIIHKFNTDLEEHVLLFSTFGVSQLPPAGQPSQLMHLQDQCWSKMLVNQIISHAWQLGQEDTMFIYNMVALGTINFLDKNKDIMHKIQCTMRGEKLKESNNEDEGDYEIEIQDGPPHRTSVASGQSAASTSVKQGTKHKVVRTYGGKNWVQNIQPTGDNNRDIFNSSSIVIDEDPIVMDEDTTNPGPDHIENANEQDVDANVALSSRQQNVTGKGKAKEKALKGKGKGKAKAVLMAIECIQQYVDDTDSNAVGADSSAHLASHMGDPDLSVSGSQNAPPIPADDYSPPDSHPIITGSQRVLSNPADNVIASEPDLIITGFQRVLSIPADNDSASEPDIIITSLWREQFIPSSPVHDDAMQGLPIQDQQTTHDTPDRLSTHEQCMAYSDSNDDIGTDHHMVGSARHDPG
ncbi:uncharacterized protein BJ212DRAFT_1486811 [Suillus subaureus]|uniref:Uncharacterized protein n=1 Tax=Suillus subaureus TaxID=48587 RepID=A0A9P7J5J9_9AGAM|nr:uncharacterized protein BJ212DRAFT_1486811 [Suillus subaureus]KAG1804170.1 hypothetical protein BJ212DRAFT_1486811 [Suillus subaureus]